MNIQIFGSSKSFDSKKAERWFKERRIKYQYIDLPSKGLSPREYQSVKQKVGFDALVNTKCRAYEDLYMAYITPDAREEKLLEHPELFVTPIVRNGREATGLPSGNLADLGVSLCRPTEFCTAAEQIGGILCILWMHTERRWPACKGEPGWSCPKTAFCGASICWCSGICATMWGCRERLWRFTCCS